MKSVMKVRDASAANSETKLREQDWILGLSARGSADHPSWMILPRVRLF